MRFDLKQWLEGRPKIIWELAEKYPPGTSITDEDGTLLYVVSYGEDGSLGMSKINPAEDYEGAVANREYLCTKCLCPST